MLSKICGRLLLGIGMSLNEGVWSFERNCKRQKTSYVMSTVDIAGVIYQQNKPSCDEP